MTENAAKDFGAIEADYDFFIAATDEAERGLDALIPYIDEAGRAGGSIRMLDFGCGGGDFSTKFLTQAGWSPDRLMLSLVEPVESQRLHAAEDLGRFTDAPITHWPALPDTAVAPFDLILSNHVLYYVPDLEVTLKQLIAALAPDGMMLLALAGRTNSLIRFWDYAFDAMGKAIPYHLSEDLDVTLARLGIAHERETVAYTMRFPDTRENRMKILRFALADHLSELPLEPLLELFDDWAKGDLIDTHTVFMHYIIRAKDL
ncbi:MAG: class I SAM-dependent methyltransferase [Pseudomonadota bacterium]